MNVSALRERWLSLASRLKLERASAIFECIVHSYGDERRAYHTLAHIGQCLSEFDEHREFAANPDRVELALWFHDVVYEPGEQFNEGLSAIYAQDILKHAGLHQVEALMVATLILATCHKGYAAGPDAELLVDIDLSILGKPKKQFIEYEAQIRAEFSAFSDAEFSTGRLKFVHSFLQKPTIYCTKVFHDKYEQEARKNLTRLIDPEYAKHL